MLDYNNIDKAFPEQLRFLKRFFVIPNKDEEDILYVWKASLLNILYVIAAIFGLPTVIVSVKLSLDADMWFLAILDSAGYLWIILNLFVRIKYIYKALALILFFIAIGFVLLYYSGPFAPALLWLFSVPILSLIFFDFKKAIITLILNLLLIVLVSFVFNLEPEQWLVFFIPLSVELLSVHILNFIFLNVMITVSLAGLIQGLKYSTISLDETQKRIEYDHARLLETNVRLRNEIANKEKIEFQLKNSQSRLKRVTAATKIGFWELDLLTKKIWGSKEALEIYGIDEITTEYIDWEIIHSSVYWEDTELNEISMKNLLAGLSDYDLRFRIKNFKTGELIWVHSKAELIKDINNMPSKVVGVITDVTNEAENQKALLKSETLYRTLFSVAKDGILLIKDGFFIECNDKAAEMFGYPKEFVTGVPPHYLSPEKQINGQDSYTLALEKINNALKGETQHFEWIHKRANDEDFYCDITLSRMELEDGFYVQTIIRDITERKKSEMIIKQSEELLKIALEASNDAIWDWNPIENQIVFSNRIKVMLGYNESEVNANYQFWIDSIHKDDLHFVNDPIQYVKLENLGSISYEYRMKDKSGNWLWVLSRGKVVHKNLDGQATRIVGTLTDLTSRIEREEEIKQLNYQLEERVIERTAQLESTLEELKYENDERKRTQDELYRMKEEIQKAYEKEKELNELKTRFVSMVSHEYRSPLTVILSSTYILDILYEKRMTEDFKQNILKIQDSVKSMTKLLDDVLLIGGNKTDQSNVLITNIEIVHIAKQLLEEIKFINKTKHNYELTTSSSKMKMNSDENMLRYILINLLNNASKYSEDGTSIWLDIADEGENIVFKVVDKGIGIPEDDKKNLFQPFYRSKNVGAVSGTGLGLAIVKSHVNMLGGDIFVTSEESEGATFTVKLPKYPNI